MNFKIDERGDVTNLDKTFKEAGFHLLILLIPIIIAILIIVVILKIFNSGEINKEVERKRKENINRKLRKEVDKNVRYKISHRTQLIGGSFNK